MEREIEAIVGEPLLPWQRDFLERALERDPETGEYRYRQVTLNAPHRSGLGILRDRIDAAR